MANKNITICDGCGKTLESTKDIYHPYACKTNTYRESGQYGEDTHNKAPILDLCLTCATNLIQTMKKIEDLLADLLKDKTNARQTLEKT